MLFLHTPPQDTVLHRRSCVPQLESVMSKKWLAAGRQTVGKADPDLGTASPQETRELTRGEPESQGWGRWGGGNRRTPG